MPHTKMPCFDPKPFQSLIKLVKPVHFAACELLEIGLLKAQIRARDGL